NVLGIYSDGNTFTSTGGIDSAGNAYSGNLLGTNVTWNNTPFFIRAAAVDNVVDSKGKPIYNVVGGTGQSILLSQVQTSSLEFLAAAVNGSQANQSILVTYTDGSSTTFTQSFSDWHTPQSYSGESIVQTMSYRDKYTGSKDSTTSYLYGYTLTL